MISQTDAATSRQFWARAGALSERIRNDAKVGDLIGQPSTMTASELQDRCAEEGIRLRIADDQERWSGLKYPFCVWEIAERTTPKKKK